ncbi:hypothetical protein EBT25_09585 [bacterium]|nr:hypothetical protein [bacterium]
MTFLEGVLAAAISAFLLAGFNKLSTLKTLGAALKYGPIIKRVFDFIDPPLVMYMNKWSGSETVQVIRLAVEAAGDGKLTGSEIATIADKVAELWLPDKAAAKYSEFKNAAQTPPGLATAKFFEEHINGGLSKDDAIGLLRAYLPK